MRSDRLDTFIKLARRIVLAVALVTGIYFAIKLAPEQATTVTSIEFAEGGFVFETSNDQRAAIIENNVLRLKIDRDNLIFSVLDKRTGHTWFSSLQTRDEDLNNTWLMFFNAPLTLEFVDSSNTTRRAYSTRDATISDFEVSERRISCVVDFTEIGAKVGLRYELDDDSLLVEVMDVVESHFRLTSLYLYPFLGASKGLVDGKIILADGVGAYMDLSKPTSAAAPFRMRVYGDDIGFKEVIKSSGPSFVSNPEIYSLPMYGIILGNVGLLVAIEDGDYYAEVHASRNGIITPYNWCTVRFVLRDFHKKLLNKKGDGVTVVQERMNSVRPKLRYVFLKHATELSFANRFAELQKRTQAEVATTSDTERYRGFMIQILMSESRRGVTNFERVVATDVPALEKMIDEIGEKLSGVVVLRGITKMGESLTSPLHLPLDEEVAKVLRRVATVGNSKTMIALRLNYLRPHIVSKKVRRTWIAQNHLEQLIESENHYVLDPKKIASHVSSEASKLREMGFERFLLAEIGRIAFSTYTSERAEVVDAVRSIVKKFGRPIVEGPLWPYVPLAAAISDTPLEHSGYEIEDGQTPLLPNVLKHFAVLYSKPVNLSPDPDVMILKCVDYGVFPSFLLTWEDPIKLIETPARDLYSTKFEDWLQYISENYKRSIDVLKHTSRTSVVSRTQLAEGVFINEYEDGTKIIVNYTGTSHRYGKEIVSAKSWKLIKGSRAVVPKG